MLQHPQLNFDKNQSMKFSDFIHNKVPPIQQSKETCGSKLNTTITNTHYAPHKTNSFQTNTPSRLCVARFQPMQHSSRQRWDRATNSKILKSTFHGMKEKYNLIPNSNNWYSLNAVDKENRQLAVGVAVWYPQCSFHKDDNLMLCKGHHRTGMSHTGLSCSQRPQIGFLQEMPSE